MPPVTEIRGTAVLTEDAPIGSACGYLVAGGGQMVSSAVRNQRCTDVAGARVTIRKGPRNLRPRCARLDRGSGHQLLTGRGVGLALSPIGTLGRGVT